MKTATFFQKLVSLFKRERQFPTSTKSSSVSIRVFIPNRDKFGHPIASEEWINYFTLLFSNIFGGCYSETVFSHYLNENQMIIREETVILNASYFGDTFQNHNVEKIISSLVQFGNETMQETVLYELNQKSFILKI